MSTRNKNTELFKGAGQTVKSTPIILPTGNFVLDKSALCKGAGMTLLKTSDRRQTMLVRSSGLVII